MGKSQPLEDLLKELAIYEATVSIWEVPDEAAAKALPTTG
jgi:hypothetical protein